ncbi:Centrosomal protein of 44 kDa [Lamellibrachia satsuma]|nr:Centrosomal protein of 44 kDa [Lamellibrachia satsuma]
MSTGDLKNNLRKLQMELKLVRVEKDVDIENLTKGQAAAFLPIYHYVFLDYSRPLAELISNINIDMYGKSDLKFLESMYKVLRELFSYKPPVTKEQFFSSSFIERKIIMCTEVLSMVRSKHKSMTPRPAARAAPKTTMSPSTQPLVRVASARPAVASDSPLLTKERGSKPPLEGSHSDKLLTQEMEPTPLHIQTSFPTQTVPNLQKTLASIMQSQRDMSARIISLENSLANVNKTDHGLDRLDDRSIGPAHLENILARLTLLENRMADIDCKKGTNSDMLHSMKSTAEDTYDSIHGSPKLRCSSGLMDMNSPGKDDLAEGDYLSDSTYADPTHRINELLKQTEEMLDKSQATAAFS